MSRVKLLNAVDVIKSVEMSYEEIALEKKSGCVL